LHRLLSLGDINDLEGWHVWVEEILQGEGKEKEKRGEGQDADSSHHIAYDVA
jgi:hypothetical protein